MLTKNQIDRLGERLKSGSTTETDLKLLDEFRRSFLSPYEFVVSAIRDRLEFDPSGRSAKTTDAIVGKLQREHVRLSQIQDIAGCRIVVANMAAQDAVVEAVQQLFLGASVVDRRLRPSHGYRAVHLIATVAELPVEVQVRTELQHEWAQLSEKYADLFGPAIKYGGGSAEVRGILQAASEAISGLELHERELTMPENTMKWSLVGRGHDAAANAVAAILRGFRLELERRGNRG